MTGATTAYEVATRLPWRRHHLELDHQISAGMEVEAHLDVLAMLGRVTVTGPRYHPRLKRPGRHTAGPPVQYPPLSGQPEPART